MFKRKEIERVKEDLEQLSRPGRCINFLLHHAVPKKDGRDVRIVFNASRKGLDAKSLNDLLLVGPKLTKNLADIVVQNRTKKYVIISNVKRLYLSILVERTYDMYNLLWQEEGEIIAYRLRTLLTGSKDAGFSHPNIKETPS